MGEYISDTCFQPSFRYVFILVANKLYTHYCLYSVPTSISLENDGLTADCGMSNKSTFSKYFMSFLKEEKHWNTEQILIKHWILFKPRKFFL